MSNFSAAVSITGDRAANFDLCLALMDFISEGSVTCDTGPQLRSHPKDRSPRPTAGFEPAT
jgi:hypothetical protein